MYDFVKIGKRTVLNRCYLFLVNMGLYLKHLLCGYEVIVSDLNREGLIMMMMPFKNVKGFIPNVLVNGDKNRKYNFRNKVLNSLINKNKLYFSDEITLANFNCKRQAENLFKIDSLKEIKQVSELIYLIILPATFSHNITKKNAKESYIFLLDIANELIKRKLKVLIKPHPRDWALYKENILKYVPEHLISLENRYNQKTLYLSFFSSVSLNKRYGEGYGLWLCKDVEMSRRFFLEELYKYSINESELLSFIDTKK